MTALFLLIRAFGKSDKPQQKFIYELYLRNTRRINNWDLVDASAEHIVGAYLLERDKKPLYRLARSEMLWERRIAIVSTFHYIKRREFAETLTIAEMLLADTHDLHCENPRLIPSFSYRLTPRVGRAVEKP